MFHISFHLTFHLTFHFIFIWGTLHCPWRETTLSCLCQRRTPWVCVCVGGGVCKKWNLNLWMGSGSAAVVWERTLSWQRRTPLDTHPSRHSVVGLTLLPKVYWTFFTVSHTNANVSLLQHCYIKFAMIFTLGGGGSDCRSLLLKDSNR